MIIKSFKLKPTVITASITGFIFIISILFFVSIANSNEEELSEKRDFIKWVDFNVSAEALNATAKLDIESHKNDEEITYNWIELLAYLACKNGGNFKNFKQKNLDNLISKLQDGETMEDLSSNLKFYNYYLESYEAVLGGFIGNYSIEAVQEDGSKKFEEKYGLKAFLPIAKNYSFSHYDDFDLLDYLFWLNYCHCNFFPFYFLPP